MCVFKHEIIKKKKEIDNIFLNGSSKFGKIIGIKALGNESKGKRTAIIIGTKVSKKAVERNRIKRLIREVLKESLDKIKNNYDIIILTLPLILGKKSKEIEKELLIILKKLNILNK